MVKVVIVNGMPGSGKSTFEKLCCKYTESERINQLSPIYCRILSSIDYVKNIAYKCGWDGVKDAKSRKFLSDLKVALTEWNDAPFRDVEYCVKDLAFYPQQYVVFVDVREPKEIQRFKEAFNATTVLIRRPGDENIETSNSSDAEVFKCDYDLTIWNNSDIINLENEAKKFIEYLKGVPHYGNGN